MHSATERLEMRLAAEEKRLLTRASEIEGIKLTKFVLDPAIKRARKVIAAAEQVMISERSYNDVLNALANPPKPTEALIASMRDYEEAGIQWR